MTFAQKLLTAAQGQPVLIEADSIRFHKIGDQVFEICVDGNRVPLSTDAGLDLSYRLTEFMADMGR